MSSLSFIFGLDWVIGLIISILILVGIIILIVLIAKKSEKNTKIVDYDIIATNSNYVVSPDEEVRGNVLTLSARRTYTVGKQNKVKPGTYHVISATKDENKLMIRLNDFVKEYEEGFEITLTEGETISPVSKSIILD